MEFDTDLMQAIPVYHEIAKKLGLNHPIEALLCAPARYQDYRFVQDDFRVLQSPQNLGANVVYRARIAEDSEGKPRIRGYGQRGMPAPKNGYANARTLQLKYPFTRGCYRLEIDLEDRYGNVMVQTVFGNIWPWKDVPSGVDLVFAGQVNRFAGNWTFSNPTIIEAHRVGGISPVYLGGSAHRVNSQEVHAIINWVSENDDRLALAYVAACDRIREECGGMDDESILAACTPENSPIKPADLPELLTSLHFPSSPEEGQAALDIVKKVCVLSMQCIAQKVNTRAPCAQAPIGKGQNLVHKAQALIEFVETEKSRARPGFSLTANQKEVISGICARLQDEVPMKGLLSGEVGAGKTMAYAIPAVVAHQAGARVAIMAPTDLLATQIANGIANDFGLDVAVERVKAGRKIRNPDAILVGTIGLNSAAKKSGWEPDLLIYDEQHKIHTAAREELVRDHTHTLEVSATPIPRSLALSLYGGMDIFVLNEQPVDKDIQTGILDTKDRSVATGALRQAINQGKRAAIVYTLVDQVEGSKGLLEDPDTKKALNKQEKEQEEKSRRSAIEAATLFEKHFPGKVALLHGKMTDDEKNHALDRFRSGDAQLIITTTIFETGIDVPEVQVLIVRDPEHLGLSQLHQLRGRLARSGGLGLCLLLTEDLQRLSADSYQRLSVFCNTLDGYELATQDMLTRGVGDLDGLQQNGKATTVFKGVKMKTKDLLSLESEQFQLEVTAHRIEELEDNRTPQPVQQRLFA